jgi:sulfate transport system permease protein
MRFIRRRILAVAIGVISLATVVDAQKAVTLLNVSYDPTRELWREIMDAIGPEEELAALSLGASGSQMFWHVTVPNVKWGLVYGIILCNARAMGEFGAVYIVSGHIAGQTDTMPLRIEKLFQEYNLPGSFAVASVLTLAAILSLVVKSRLERRHL